MLLLGVIALSVCLQACSSKEVKVPYYNTADLTPTWQSSAEVHKVQDFSFTNQEGEEVTNDIFEHKVYVANFFFATCPGICPKMNSNMKTVAEKYSNNDAVKFISHSVTPYIDSVPKLKEYADMHGIDSKQWYLVTGSKGDIYRLARQSYFAEDEIGFNSDSTEFLHTERFVLVDKNKQIRGVYNGTVSLEMERLVTDIDMLLKE